MRYYCDVAVSARTLAARLGFILCVEQGQLEHVAVAKSFTHVNRSRVGPEDGDTTGLCPFRKKSGNFNHVVIANSFFLKTPPFQGSLVGLRFILIDPS